MMSDRLDVEAPLVPTSVVAEYMGCSPETVRRMFDTEREFDDAPRPVKLSKRPGARLRWRMEDVVRWVESQAGHGQSSNEVALSRSPRPSRSRYQDQRW